MTLPYTFFTLLSLRLYLYIVKYPIHLTLILSLVTVPRDSKEGSFILQHSHKKCLFHNWYFEQTRLFLIDLDLHFNDDLFS